MHAYSTSFIITCEYLEPCISAFLVKNIYDGLVSNTLQSFNVIQEAPELFVFTWLKGVSEAQGDALMLPELKPNFLERSPRWKRYRRRDDIAAEKWSMCLSLELK